MNPAKLGKLDNHRQECWKVPLPQFDVLTTDGPYIEGKEHIGGLSIIKAPDLDSALEWPRKLARAIRLLPIEVRPFQGDAEH